MERENRRKYPIFDQLSTEELEKLLAQDFVATDGEEPDVDYIMAIMGVINKRETAAGHQPDVDAAWKEFQEDYQGQAAAFERTNACETESSDHHQISHDQVARKHTRVFRYVLVAAIFVVLLCGTASGFGRVFQAVVNWSAETFGFEAPYKTGLEENATVRDPYADLRALVFEYTDLPVIPNWAPDSSAKVPDAAPRIIERDDMTQLSAIYDIGTGRFVIRAYIHKTIPPQYVVSYQWNEPEIIKTIVANGIHHDIVKNNENYVATWTNENAECMIQGNLSVEELEKMIDSIYKE